MKTPANLQLRSPVTPFTCLNSQATALSDSTTNNGYDEYTAEIQGKRRFAIRNPLLRECIAELVSTCVLMTIGLGSIAQAYLTHGEKGNFITICFAWAVAVMSAIHVAGGVSGAFLNPAAAFAFAVFGRLPWRKVIPYSIAELIGAYLGSAIVYFIYYSEFHNHADWSKSTASIFSTFPAEGVSHLNAFLNEVLGTAYVVGMAFAVDDKRNHPASKFTVAATMGMVVFSGIVSFCHNSGFAINPARDLGPRLFMWTMEWGNNVFVWSDYYFWIPIVAPVIGAPLGGALYYFTIQLHHPLESVEQPNTMPDPKNNTDFLA